MFESACSRQDARISIGKGSLTGTPLLLEIGRWVTRAGDVGGDLHSTLRFSYLGVRLVLLVGIAIRGPQLQSSSSLNVYTSR